MNAHPSFAPSPPTAPPDAWHDALIAIARVTRDVANYCDHVEHCEDADRGVVFNASEVFREQARLLASAEGERLSLRYAARLSEVQRRSPVYPVDRDFDVSAAVTAAPDWAALQRVQARHDRLYHADVVGLHKQDQLRHCALHMAKLTGALADGTGDGHLRQTFVNGRLADLVLFSLKLATLLGHRLTGELGDW